MKNFQIFFVLATLVLLVQSVPMSKGKLDFKVSGRNLPDKDTGFGTTDGYFELFVSNDGGLTKSKLTRSPTINDQENPDWGTAFSFDFDRSKNQWWFFFVYDEDNMRQDDTVGRVWINVADYVDKGQTTQARLDKDNGYLIIQSLETPQSVFPNTPVGQLQMPIGTPEAQILKLRLSASNLPTKDDIGFIPGSSDPYVIISANDGISGKERHIGRSGTVVSSSNPNWGDVFQFQWNKKQNQRLHFIIYDNDKLREDDKIASVWMELNDYVAKGQNYKLPLPKGGILTITKAV